MAKTSQKDDAEDVQARLSKILAGAFSGSPTPLKDVPTRTGKKRKMKKANAKKS
jgi:hypothetical protein